MNRLALFSLVSLTLATTSLTAQSGRTMRLMAPAVLGQTAAFAMRHPVAVAGNAFLLAIAAPNFPGAVSITIPGFTVSGLLRIDPTTFATPASGVLDASGQTPSLLFPIPNNPNLLSFTFDVQGIDINANSVLNFSDDDIEIAVSAAPPASLNLASINPGTFTMGAGGFGPAHQVTITRPFWIGRTEVTQAAYQALMGSNPSGWQGPTGPTRPVENVTWFQAVAFCDALSVQEAQAGRLPTGYEYRLPTEAEWEYCCRAGTTTSYNVGNVLGCGQANFWTCVNATSPVGTYNANAWGLRDVHGNVREWCLDLWDGNSYPSSAPVSDPYSTTGIAPVIRGGSWAFGAGSCASAYRDLLSATSSGSSVGFRVVCGPVIP